MFFEYWYIFPIATVVATIAMASGVEGAAFFTPLFIIALRLPPEVAIGIGLITEVFGFSSGLVSYVKKGFIDYKLGVSMLIVTLPLSIIGTVLTAYIPSTVLKVLLGSGLLIISLPFFKAFSRKYHDTSVELEACQEGEKGVSTVTTWEGEKINYKVCNRVEGMSFSALGALFVGMLSTGLGEINGWVLLKRCKVPARVAVATSVFIVAITVLVASVGHLIQFAQAGADTLNIVLKIVIFTIPGVILGGQLGPLIASRISQKNLEKGLSLMFVVVAFFMLGDVFHIFG